MLTQKQLLWALKVSVQLIESEAAVYLLKNFRLRPWLFSFWGRVIHVGKYWLNFWTLLIPSRWKRVRAPPGESVQNKCSFFCFFFSSQPMAQFSFPQQMSTWVSLCNFSVCGAKLVAAIRAALVKGRGSGDALYAAAEETTRGAEGEDLPDTWDPETGCQWERDGDQPCQGNVKPLPQF